MAVTNDSDVPILGGDNSTVLKEYVKVDKMTLVSTCKNTLENAMKYLPAVSKNAAKIVDAECPIFENVKSMKLRALMMVALGCEVYKPGIVGVGPKTLKKKNDNLKDEIREEHEQARHGGSDVSSAIEACSKEDKAWH